MIVQYTQFLSVLLKPCFVFFISRSVVTPTSKISPLFTELFNKKMLEYNQQIDGSILTQNQFEQLSSKIKMEGFIKLSKSKNRCTVQDINLQWETSMPFKKIWTFGNIKTLKKTLWPLFVDGVQLYQGQSHFEEPVYFLPLSSQKSLVLILSTSEA